MLWAFVGPRLAEGQPTTSPAPPTATPPGSLGLAAPVRITVGGDRVDPGLLSTGTVLIADQNGRVLAQTVPQSPTVVIYLPVGRYTVKFQGVGWESPVVPVSVERGQGGQAVLPLQPVAVKAEPWKQFWSGVGDRVDKLSTLRQGGTSADRPR